MNFWEARQAALDGKKVKLSFPSSEILHYDKNTFALSNLWTKYEVDGTWEIVEEPKTNIYYVVGYEDMLPFFKCKQSAQDFMLKNDGLSAIEIITDENGRLVSAKNV